MMTGNPRRERWPRHSGTDPSTSSNPCADTYSKGNQGPSGATVGFHFHP